MDVLEGKLMTGRRRLHQELQVQREQQKNLLMSRITEENKETPDARKELDRYMGTLGSLSAKTATMKVVSDFTETDLSSLPDDVDWMEAVRGSVGVGDEQEEGTVDKNGGVRGGGARGGRSLSARSGRARGGGDRGGGARGGGARGVGARGGEARGGEARGGEARGGQARAGGTGSDGSKAGIQSKRDKSVLPFISMVEALAKEVSFNEDSLLQ